MNRTLCTLAALAALAPTSASAMFPASAKNASPTVAFPDVCKTPVPGGPVAIPYASGAVQGKDQGLDVETATKGTQPSGKKVQTTTINASTLPAVVANFDLSMEELLSEAPEVPAECTGKAAAVYWNQYEVWSSTVGEMMLLLEDVQRSASRWARADAAPMADAAWINANAAEYLSLTLLRSADLCSTASDDVVSAAEVQLGGMTQGTRGAPVVASVAYHHFALTFVANVRN
ncbi:MAG: hypothetical protein AAF721_32090 [Myxococcota bacterium]